MSRDLLELIPKFMEVFTSPPVTYWNQQIADLVGGKFENVRYRAPSTKRPLTENDWLLHFTPHPRQHSTVAYGSYAINGNFNEKVRWVCFDADSKEDWDVVTTKLAPYLESKEISYILEFSQANRCHFWVPTEEVSWDLADSFFGFVLEETCIGKHSESLLDEIYPLNCGGVSKKNAVIRPPGGFHMRNGKVNPIEYNGITSNDPIFIMQSFIDCPKLSKEKMLKLYKPVVKVVKKTTGVKRDFKRFLYTGRGLPTHGAPNGIKKMVSNCQAISKILDLVKTTTILDDRRGKSHDTGLYLANLAKLSDEITKTNDGEKWFDDLARSRRSRSPDSHNWKFYKTKAAIVPHCQTWDRTYGLCEGCPFKNFDGFISPRNLLNGKEVEKVKIGEINFTTPEKIQKELFPKIEDRIKQLLDCGEREDILVATSQGSGKSSWIDEYTAKLSKLGHNVLIAVPTVDVAIEHRDRLRSFGIEPHMLISHQKWFSKDKIDLGFDCPSYTDIQAEAYLGVNSAVYKERYCAKCPFLEKCPYPRQYLDVELPEHKVVIINHAHFSLKEIVQNKILSKPFPIMFVDESFKDNILFQIEAMEEEYEKLLSLGFSWSTRLGSWMKNGGYPQGSVAPSEQQLKATFEAFEAAGIPWRIRELIRLFNENKYMTQTHKIKLFYEVPNIPIRVFTDATPPVEVLEIILNNKVNIFGKDEIISPKYFHPDNEVIQVLDSTSSKTKLTDDILASRIEYIVAEIDEKFPTEKILITTYKSLKEKVRGLIASYAPDMIDRVTVDHGKIGINDYHDFGVQFLLCQVSPNGKTMQEGVYELKSIANYWRKKFEIPILQNPFPMGATETDGWLKVDDTIKKIELDGLYEYPQIKNFSPYLDFNRYVFKDMVAVTQQWIRLRYKPGEKRTIYLFTNYSFPSFPITKIVVEEEMTS